MTTSPYLATGRFGRTLVDVSGADRPENTEVQEPIMQHILGVISLASDLLAIAAAVTSLVDTAVRHRNNPGEHR